jgi:hypothetical protein
MTPIALTLAFYKVLHIFGVILMFAALGALVYRALSGDTNEGGRKLAGMSHGIALVLILITGFGALAKLGFGGDSGFPLWLIGKLVLWLLFGGVLVLIRKKPEWAKLLWWLLPILGGLAAYLALYKPT